MILVLFLRSEVPSMKATVLVDNIAYEKIPGEWGLSIYIEYDKHQILLDTGASGLFIKNAEKLGIDIKKIDFAVLSHAHFDHANGMEDFFFTNLKAKFYLREGSAENNYIRRWFFSKYIGIKKKTLKTFANRIVYVEGDYELIPGVYLIPHKNVDLSWIGKRHNMYRKEKGRWKADDFSHEQSLVFRTDQGLVIFNSCSHGGADQIIREVSETFPGEKLYAIIGGFHTYQEKKQEIQALSERIRNTGIEKIYTGHCTGKGSLHVLQEELGDIVNGLHSGLEMEF